MPIAQCFFNDLLLTIESLDKIVALWSKAIDVPPGDMSLIF